ncbi:MAG: alpha/beta hydrolase [Thermoanaerobaculia bacterium]
MRKLARLVSVAVIAVTFALFSAAFVMVFLGDPAFAPAPAPTPEAIASFMARFAQPYPAIARRFRMRDGVTLNARVFPADSRATIVLVHGVLESSLPLNRTAGLLREAAGANVVAIDLRGHGESGGAPGDVSYIGQYEDDLADVVTQVRAGEPEGRVLLAGHSMGGGVALRFAQKGGMPHVDGYLLFAPHLGPRSPTTPQETTSAGASFVQIHLPRILGLAFFNGVGITTFNGLHTLFFNLPRELPLRSYSYRAMAGMCPSDHVPALRAIHEPLLVIVGSKDEAFHADRYDAAVRPHGRGEVVVVPGASHDGVLDDPRAMAAVHLWMPAAAGAVPGRL